MVIDESVVELATIVGFFSIPILVLVSKLISKNIKPVVEAIKELRSSSDAARIDLLERRLAVLEGQLSGRSSALPSTSIALALPESNGVKASP